MKTISFMLIIVCGFFFSNKLFAQQHDHNMNMKMDTVKKKAPQKTIQKKTATAKKIPAKQNMKMPMSDKKVASDTAKAAMNMDKNMSMGQMKSMNDTAKPGLKMNMDKNMNMNQMNMADTSMKGMGDHEMMMTNAYSINLPMSRDGSGTSWVPDASQTYMLMKINGRTSLMLHGNIFLRYTKQDLFNKGNRGGDKFDAPNWLMGMLNQPVGKKGLFTASAMISFDRLTEGGNGYPLLFQSGETWNGKKLVDRQHPHDLFPALTIGYSYVINKNCDVYGYLGYPGEPALGPPVFMHRNSAMNNPDAPLSHHWQDATHITFGVATLGFRYKIFKAEGSVFTGREPNENRYDFDKARFDSYSYRLSLNPNENWAFQFSQGFLTSPEASEPDIDITRTTTSVLYSKHFTELKAHLDGALVWGLNSPDVGQNENSLLLEGNLQFRKSAVYSRYEFVQKSADELDLVNEFGDTRFNINAISVGYNHILLPGQSFGLSAGTRLTLNIADKKLDPIYGKAPMAGEIYLQLKPRLHSH
jgi:hypothetical protein